jgi:hypothetical protein
MKRRAFITGVGAVLAAPLAAEAQQTGRYTESASFMLVLTTITGR